MNNLVFAGVGASPSPFSAANIPTFSEPPKLSSCFFLAEGALRQNLYAHYFLVAEVFLAAEVSVVLADAFLAEG